MVQNSTKNVVLHRHDYHGTYNISRETWSSSWPRHLLGANKSSCNFLVQQNNVCSPLNNSSDMVLPPHTSDISAQRQLEKARGRICILAMLPAEVHTSDSSDTHVHTSAHLLLSHVWPSVLGKLAVIYALLAWSHMRDIPFGVFRNWLTCIQHSTNTIFLPQDLHFHGMMLEKAQSENIL